MLIIVIFNILGTSMLSRHFTIHRLLFTIQIEILLIIIITIIIKSNVKVFNTTDFYHIPYKSRIIRSINTIINRPKRKEKKEKEKNTKEQSSSRG